MSASVCGTIVIDPCLLSFNYAKYWTGLMATVTCINLEPKYFYDYPQKNIYKRVLF